MKNNSKKDSSNNLDLNDALTQSGKEVAGISDSELSKQFMVYNDDALNNPDATFKENYFEEAEFIFSQHVLDETLKIKIINELKEEQQFQNQSLSKNKINIFLQQKKKIINKKIVNLNINKLISDSFEIQDKDWVNYEKSKIEYQDNFEIKKQYIKSCFLQHISKWSKFKSIVFKELSCALIIILLTILNSILINKNIIKNGTENTAFHFLIGFRFIVYIFLSLGIIFIIIPILFLMILWYVGINDIILSKNYHFMIFYCLMFGIISEIISLIFLVSIILNNT